MSSKISDLNRRAFLRTAVAGSAVAGTLPGFLARTTAALEAAAANPDGPILVVLQMAGGNDGLNTVIPVADDHYVRARPRLRSAAVGALRLNDRLSLHAGLRDWKELFDQGRLGLVQGVGYANPNRSHFRSTEIWQTASEATATTQGWLGRYFAAASASAKADATIGLALSRQLPQAFAGPKPLGMAMDNPAAFGRVAGEAGTGEEAEAIDRLLRDKHPGDEMDGELREANAGGSVGALAGTAPIAGSVLEYVERTAADAQRGAARVAEASARGRNHAPYPPSKLGQALQSVARLIAGGMRSRVYYVSQGGYDTHTQQLPTHERLLRELAGAVKAFVADLEAQGNLDRVLLMTFSEFGRRVKENANGGTDHGAAAPLFLVGTRLKAGVHGSHPSLDPADLLRGDLRFSVDFRSIYATVLERWLGTPSLPILGRSYPMLNCL